VRPTMTFFVGDNFHGPKDISVIAELVGDA
jgi:hypothetical protein